jgi:hypothetical protein
MLTQLTEETCDGCVGSVSVLGAYAACDIDIAHDPPSAHATPVRWEIMSSYFNAPRPLYDGLTPCPSTATYIQTLPPSDIAMLAVGERRSYRAYRQA